MRTFEEINKEYGNMCAQLGETYFQIEELKKKMLELGSRISQLTQEVIARNMLDAELAAAEKAKVETPAQ